jgi:transposase-like protein
MKNCPRCDSENTTQLGVSLCHGDKEDRFSSWPVFEYYCGDCELLWREMKVSTISRSPEDVKDERGRITRERKGR